jgi:hypothetical protein
MLRGGEVSIMAVNAELVEVRGWYRGVTNFSLLYSIRSRIIDVKYFQVV